MKKHLIVAALAMLAFASPSKAEVIDLATIKCSELANMSSEDASYLFTWLHGYFGGQAGDTTMDLANMESSGKTIGEYCAVNPEVGIVSAVQQSLGN